MYIDKIVDEIILHPSSFNSIQNQSKLSIFNVTPNIWKWLGDTPKNFITPLIKTESFDPSLGIVVRKTRLSAIIVITLNKSCVDTRRGHPPELMESMTIK